MKLSQKIGGVLLILLIIALGACCLGIFQQYQHKTSEIDDLKERIAYLTQQEKKSAIMQSVNAQMEQIANQERIISEEQREEAVQQSKLANEARRHAEEERQNALDAEHRALEASKVAQKERIIAEQQRVQAEHSKRIADTLSYVALGRSLGSLSINQRKSGNKELSDLLAYASYLFTERYFGDVYNPIVYTALLQASQSKRVWSKHRGAVSDIEFMPHNDFHFVSSSTYGELFEHHIGSKTLQTTTLYSNNNFDFRDILIDQNKTIYAVSRNGFLLVKGSPPIQFVLLEGIGYPMGIAKLGNDLLIIGEDGLALFNKEKQEITNKRKLSFKVITHGTYKHHPLLFDDKGQMHFVKDINDIQTTKLTFKGQVTAFAYSNNNDLRAYGMKDGSIIYIDNKGKVRKLSGHRSRISKIKINGWRIYSTSYDGTLNLWMGKEDRIEPMELFSAPGWIMNFTFDNSKCNIWAGDNRGNLTEAFFDVKMMFLKLKDNLNRNMTHEEWNFYIGKNIPYEKFVRKEGGQ